MRLKPFIKIFTLGFAVYFVSWFLVSITGLNKLNVQSEDTIPAMFMPVTIIKQGTLYADSYYEMIRARYPHPDDKSGELGLTPFYFRKISSADGMHYISAFPLVTGIMAVPVYFLPVIFGMPITFENLAILSHITGAIIVSLSGCLLYLLLNRHLVADDSKAKLLTGIYMFGTVNYALVSQALWQHGTLELFVILGLHFMFNLLTLKGNSYKYAFLSSLFLGLAVLSRPTAALIWILVFMLLVFSLKHLYLKKLITLLTIYLMGLVVCLGIFVFYNAQYYVSLDNQGYYDQVQTEWLSKFPEGFLGVWFSPSKGILIYSPIFIFSIVGLITVVKRHTFKEDAPYIVFALIVLLHTLVIGKWKHWYGGWSFGYRMSSDIIPFLVLLLVPYVTSPFFERTKRMFYAFVGLSVAVQIYGMVFFDGIWHAAYDRGFVNTSWLWSIRDSELVFNIRRILVKLGVLTKACPVCE